MSIGFCAKFFIHSMVDVHGFDALRRWNRWCYTRCRCICSVLTGVSRCTTRIAPIISLNFKICRCFKVGNGFFCRARWRSTFWRNIRSECRVDDFSRGKSNGFLDAPWWRWWAIKSRTNQNCSLVYSTSGLRREENTWRRWINRR